MPPPSAYARKTSPEVDGGHPIGPDLADGIVTVDHAGADPYAQQIGYAACGRPVAVHYARTGCQLHLRERDHVRHLATALDLH